MPVTQSTRTKSLLFPVPNEFFERAAWQILEPEIAYVGPIPSPLSFLEQPAFTTTYTSYVYLLVSELGGDVIYVGMTRDPQRRLAQHSVQKEWWGCADKLVLLRMDGESKAAVDHYTRLMELDAIRSLKPVYNIAGVVD